MNPTTNTSPLSRLSLTAALLILLCAATSLTAYAQAAPAQVEGQQQFADLGNCKLESGQQITGCKLGYRTFGKLNADSSNAILFPTWFTGTSEQIAANIAPGKLVDPTQFFVIVVDAMGDGVSSSPSNSSTQPRMAFPAFTIRDMVATEYRLATETLHLKHLHAVMGISMGGMQTFEWMIDYPGFMDLSIPIVGSTRLTSYDLVLWQAQEDAIRSSPAWQNGNYAKTPALPQVAILHEMNLATPAHFARENPRETFAKHYAAYATTGATEFDANDRIYQLEAMIHHDIAHGGTLEEAAKKVHAKVLVVPSEQDHMVNPGPAIAFAKLLGAKTFLLTSDCGHIAVACEADKLNPAVAAFLDGK